MYIEVTPGGAIPSFEVVGKGTGMNQETSIRSKFFSHFIKIRISFSPMETILMILGELEHLENLI